MRSPTVSIIIVNWNCETFLEDCFGALKDQTCKDFEIVFIDNASTDNSLRFAKTLAAQLSLNATFVELGENRGFAAGNNEGLKYCGGSYIALLNADTIAGKDWLKTLINEIDAHPDVGICASKLIVQGENVIDSAGDGYSTFGHAFKRGEGNATEEFSKKEYVFGACAGAALYRRAMVEEIGLFDEDFFLIFEDTDLNFRAQLNGWKCLYVPAAVYHKVGASIKKIGSLNAYYCVRNDKLVKIKNLSLSVAARRMPGLILGEIIWLIYFTIQGKLKHYVRAHIDVVKMVPALLKKRREIMKLKKVSDSYIYSLLTSGFRLYGISRIKRYLEL